MPHKGLARIWSEHLKDKKSGTTASKEKEEEKTSGVSASSRRESHVTSHEARGRQNDGDGIIAEAETQSIGDDRSKPVRWSMGVLNDHLTHQVPGSVLLLANKRNEPLGMRDSPILNSSPSIRTDAAVRSRQNSSIRKASHGNGKKLTPDGKIILEPQPDDSANDPLNWPGWKRDLALLSMGIYCMVGGGMTPILAAGFTDVAETYDTTTAKVALTTGLYMMGLGVGSVFASPTAILYGKRPVYLVGALLFILTSIWCAASPSYNSLLLARIIQGISVSPVECLPSATIAEIFFLHERAFRIGIYTLLLLGGKNLVPLVSAAIIQSLSWRWVFWIVTIVAGFCWILLFLFVPETFWDRRPVPSNKRTSKPGSISSRLSLLRRKSSIPPNPILGEVGLPDSNAVETMPHGVEDSISAKKSSRHVDFAPGTSNQEGVDFTAMEERHDNSVTVSTPKFLSPTNGDLNASNFSNAALPNHPSFETGNFAPVPMPKLHDRQDQVEPSGFAPPTPLLHNINSPYYNEIEKSTYFRRNTDNPEHPEHPEQASPVGDNGKDSIVHSSRPQIQRYTSELRTRPTLTFIQQLKPFNGRLHHDNWFRVAIRPFILFAYPAVLWSSIVYACSVGWLIVLSESVAEIYRNHETYNFSALSTGLIYISPFIGGVLGTAVAGKVSDVIVKAMSRRNAGLYEPEFRLVMAIPVAIATVIGLMGFGWSAEAGDHWIVPTVFFGIISFGCSLGSTTAITFCVDSYRQYAGEALVTLNFTKNIFHGLVFSLFFPHWLEGEGSKSVFIWLGVIQLVLMLLTVPMYIFGKRARMWTVRKDLMERF